MTEEQKQRNLKFAEALESGRYNQIRWTLRTLVGFCAIGVGCDVFWTETGEFGWECASPHKTHFTFKGHGAACPKEVKGWYGWSSDYAEAISNWNDFQDLDFRSIAQRIRMVVG